MRSLHLPTFKHSGFPYIYISLSKTHSKTCQIAVNPVDTRRRFNVDRTSCDVARRRINVETMSCVDWEKPFTSFKKCSTLDVWQSFEYTSAFTPEQTILLNQIRGLLLFLKYSRFYWLLSFWWFWFGMSIRSTNFFWYYLISFLVDGNWSPWGQWSSCSATVCGDGISQRVRTCTDPKPLLNGRECSGKYKESQKCRNGACKKG